MAIVQAERKILQAQCAAALNEQQTAAIDPMHETKQNRISYLFFTLREPIFRQNDQKYSKIVPAAVTIVRSAALL